MRTQFDKISKAYFFLLCEDVQLNASTYEYNNIQCVTNYFNRTYKVPTVLKLYQYYVYIFIKIKNTA